MASPGWYSLPVALRASVSQLQDAINNDAQFTSFTDTKAMTEPITFGIQASGSDEAILVTATPLKSTVATGPPDKAAFILVARPDQWEQFFQPIPKMPYQSWGGLIGMDIAQEAAAVHGNELLSAQFHHLARRTLELLRDGLHGTMKEENEAEPTEDHITGRYVFVDPPVWGRSKVFVETSGNGPQSIVFCHTAGSDSRQYHGVMNDKRAMEKLTMHAFDLPSHGRSFPGKNHVPGNHTNDEDAYVGCIREVIRVLGLTKPIVCGASMAGQVCLAVAVRADEVGAAGTIPLQGCDYLNMPRVFHDKSPQVNQSLFNPELVYGLMSPTTPHVNKQLIWHLYSGQAYGIFHGDLDFYFGGWDGRDRMAKIDTDRCPVYMLTGEYDWSNTPAMSKATSEKIKGNVQCKTMPGLGHFPATEKPAAFTGHLLEAVEWIRKVRK